MAELKSSAVIKVGITGFEPVASNSRSWRANRTALHPETYFIKMGNIVCNRNC